MVRLLFENKNTLKAFENSWYYQIDTYNVVFQCHQCQIRMIWCYCLLLYATRLNIHETLSMCPTHSYHQSKKRISTHVNIFMTCRFGHLWLQRRLEILLGPPSLKLYSSGAGAKAVKPRLPVQLLNGYVLTWVLSIDNAHNPKALFEARDTQEIRKPSSQKLWTFWQKSHNELWLSFNVYDIINLAQKKNN